MATLAEVRARVRLRLEEVSAAVWTDAEIDEGITAALDDYNTLYPLEMTTTAVVADGATSCAMPSGAQAVVRVVRENGDVIPRRGVPEGWTGDERLAWERYAAQLRFSAALDAETLTIWYLGPHAIEEVPDRDIGLLVAGAYYRALTGRWVQDAKRGNLTASTGLGQLAGVVREARHEYADAKAARARWMRVTAVQRA